MLQRKTRSDIEAHKEARRAVRKVCRKKEKHYEEEKLEELQEKYKRNRMKQFYANKNPTDTTVCRCLFTAKLLYMFRVSQHPSSGVLKTEPAASRTGHTTCTATPLQRGLIGTQSRSDHVGTVFNTPDDGCCDT